MLASSGCGAWCGGVGRARPRVQRHCGSACLHSSGRRAGQARAGECSARVRVCVCVRMCRTADANPYAVSNACQVLGTWSGSVALVRACASSIASLLSTTPPPPLDVAAEVLGALVGLINHSDAAVVRAGCSGLAAILCICSYERVNVRRWRGAARLHLVAGRGRGRGRGRAGDGGFAVQTVGRLLS